MLTHRSPRPGCDRPQPARRSIGNAALLVAAAAGVVTSGSPAVAADADQAAPAAAQAAVQLVPIRLPLAGDDDSLYRGVIQRAVDQLRQLPGPAGGRPTLVLELEVDPRVDPPDGRGSQFERVLALANYLGSDQLAGVKTVAYVPQTVKGHGVLLAVACEEIAMAPDAELGEAAIDEPADKPVGIGLITFYQQLAEARRTVPTAVAVGWVDRQAEVYRVESEDRIDLVLGRDLPALQKERIIVNQELLAPRGTLGLQTGRQGRELGFVKYLAADRAALARVLGVPAPSLEQSPALLREWSPVVIDIQGPVTSRTVRQVETLIGEEIGKRGANWIGLRIDSSGGDLESCIRLAATIAELEGSEVRTVAYVPVEAGGAAGLVALACDQLVMHPEATVGGGILSKQAEGDPGPAELEPAPGGDEDDNEGDDKDVAPQDGPDAAAEVEGDDAFDPPAVEAPAVEPADAPEGENGGPNDNAPKPARRLPPRQDDAALAEDAAEPAAEQDSEAAAAALAIRETLAPATDRTASLLTALVDPDLAVFRYTNRETGERRLLSRQAAAELPDAAAWRQGAKITRRGESLKLDAESATDLGVAWQVVEGFDELKRLYGFEADPRTATPNWANELVTALASPQLAMLLLLIGFIGIYVELNMPGVGFGGFIAAVAFVLFFWSRFTAQTAGLLEVMLFLTGVVCILIELLVLPGFGIFGLGGTLLVLASLVLANQTFWLPETESQLDELRTSLGTVAGAFVSFLVAGVLMRRYLPSTPLFRQMTLAPPAGADKIEQDNREAVADYAYLVGMTGVAATDLLPAGKAEIDGELLDVIAEGDIVDRGAEVVVVKARATRIVVRATRG
ncbi:MAG: NfeD family protein [Planctomycetota bacterium]